MILDNVKNKNIKSLKVDIILKQNAKIYIN